MVFVEGLYKSAGRLAVLTSSSFSEPPTVRILPVGSNVAFISMRGWLLAGPLDHHEGPAVREVDHAVAEHVPTLRSGGGGVGGGIPHSHHGGGLLGVISGARNDENFAIGHQRGVNRIDGHQSRNCLPSAGHVRLA